MTWEVRVSLKDRSGAILLGTYDAQQNAETKVEGIFKKAYFRIKSDTESFSYYPTSRVTKIELVKVK